jgi:molybdenum cofactor cytidylyltransferase/nicotine blue oxidoreductase
MPGRAITDQVVGLLLAAGAGRRMGGPKALIRDEDGTSWLLRSIDVLRDGGCVDVTVVVGAEADAVRELLTDENASVVEAARWAEGMGASLRTGLWALAQSGDEAVAACVHLVDLPDVGAKVVARVIAAADPVTPDALVRATYSGRPGHPVLIGRDHWTPIAAGAGGDRGARTYLDAYDAQRIECADLATGRDVDRRS